MNEPFLLQVDGREYRARLERYGYSHRIAVLIDETTVIFEPCEDGSYRALTDQPIDSCLLRFIAERLVELCI